MSAGQLFGLSLTPALRALQRWNVQRRLAAIRYHLTYIQGVRANDYQAERLLQAEQAQLRSTLRRLS
jgi:hypothetical protein